MASSRLAQGPVLSHLARRIDHYKTSLFCLCFYGALEFFCALRACVKKETNRDIFVTFFLRYFASFKTWRGTHATQMPRP
jgi:hypothetical protein